MEANVFTFLKDSGFEGLALLLLFGSLAVFGLWALVLGVLWAASYPRLPSAGPETTDLGPEPPAISNLLVHRFKVTHAAMPATLLDLAARRLLEIQMLGRDNFVIRVKARDSDGDDLLPYERQLFNWVKSQATGGSAPLEALSVGTAGQAASFWGRFQDSVISDARKRGLVRSRWAKRDWVILGAILAVAMGLLALSFGSAGVGDGGSDPMNTGDWLLFAAFGWAGILAVITRFQDLRDTKKGQEVAGRWLGVRNAFRKSTAFNDVPPSHVTIWERNLSHAVALGLAHEAVRQLPFDEEDPETAWTRQTGVWREIDISYPVRFGFSERPLWVLWGGIWRVAVWGGLAFFVVPITSRILWDVVQEFRTSNAEQLNDISPLAINGLIAIIVAFVGGWTAFLLVRFSAGLIRLWRSLSDLGKPPIVVEGEVVKLHMGRIAVDDGKVEETKAWIPPLTAPALTRGMKVRFTRTPNLWHVTNVEILKLPGGVEPRAATATRSSGAGGVSGGLAFNLPALNAATGLSLSVDGGNADAELDAEMAGVVGPFGRPVASGAYTDGRIDVHIVKLDPAVIGGVAGTLMSFMTSKAEQRMARFDGAGDSGFWMGEDTLIVSEGETRYMVRVTGAEDLERRQLVAEQVARVVVEGTPSPAVPAANPIPGAAAGPLGNPIFAAAAAAAAMVSAAAAKRAGAETTGPAASESPPEIDDTGATDPAADTFPGWQATGTEGDADLDAEAELEVFEPREVVAEPPAEAGGVLYTPPPLFDPEEAAPDLNAPDVDAVATADGRVILPADVRPPTRGFPRPGRRFGPDDDDDAESDVTAGVPPFAVPTLEPAAANPVPVAQESLAAGEQDKPGEAAIAAVAALPPARATVESAPSPAKQRPEIEPRGFPRPRARVANADAADDGPVQASDESAASGVEVEAAPPPAPRQPTRNPWKR